MIKQVDRYIGGAAVLGILGVWLGLTLLMLMFNLLDELGSSDSRYQIFEVLWYVALTTPRAAHMVFPVSCLLGALIGIGGLAATNELVAFRTAGVSRLRIAGSALGATLLLAIPVMIMAETLLPVAERQASTFKQSRILGQVMVGGARGLWVRDGSDFVNIKAPWLSSAGGKTTVEFRDVVVYSFEESRLQQVTRARNATHDGEQWTLEWVKRVVLDPQGVYRERHRTEQWASAVEPEHLDSAVTRPRYMSIKSLLRQLEYLVQNGIDDRVYRSVFWAKIFYPLTAMALVLAGMPFVFGSARHHNMGVRIFIGMSLGGIFMIVGRAVQNMGDAYHLPPVLSTAGPSLLLMLVVVLVLRRSV